MNVVQDDHIPTIRSCVTISSPVVVLLGYKLGFVLFLMKFQRCLNMLPDMMILSLEKLSLFDDSPCSITEFELGPNLVGFSTSFLTRWISLSMLELLLDMLTGLGNFSSWKVKTLTSSSNSDTDDRRLLFSLSRSAIVFLYFSNSWHMSSLDSNSSSKVMSSP